jgi:hypothetical protein
MKFFNLIKIIKELTFKFAKLYKQKYVLLILDLKKLISI